MVFDTERKEKRSQPLRTIFRASGKWLIVVSRGVNLRNDEVRAVAKWMEAVICEMKKMQDNSDSPYPVYFLPVDSIGQLAGMEVPTRYFIVLVCADFDAMAKEEILGAADVLMDKGNVYFCAWGPGCKRAHDLYDEAAYEKERKTGTEWFVMTTSHAKETLDDALWFALFLAGAEDEHPGQCCTLVVTVGNAEWAKKIEGDLSDIAAFNERVLENVPDD